MALENMEGVCWLMVRLVLHSQVMRLQGQTNPDIALQGAFTVSPCTILMDQLLAAVTLSTGTTCTLGCCTCSQVSGLTKLSL